MASLGAIGEDVSDDVDTDYIQTFNPLFDVLGVPTGIAVDNETGSQRKTTSRPLGG